MFERFTEKARRAIFFARLEASELGSPKIEAEMLLLGLARECGDLFIGLAPGLDAESLRALVRDRFSDEKLSTSTDMPLSDEARQALDRALEEADRLGSQFVTEQHLLLGLVDVQGSFVSELLVQHGVNAATIRQSLANRPMLPSDSAVGASEMRIQHTSLTGRFGKYRGTVLDNEDPEMLGRIRVGVPSIGVTQNWAMPCVPYPAGTPTLTIPPIGSAVWVEFEGGNPNYPIWSGCFWNIGDTPLLIVS